MCCSKIKQLTSYKTTESSQKVTVKVIKTIKTVCSLQLFELYSQSHHLIMIPLQILPISHHLFASYLT